MMMCSCECVALSIIENTATKEEKNKKGEAGNRDTDACEVVCVSACCLTFEVSNRIAAKCATQSDDDAIWTGLIQLGD